MSPTPENHRLPPVQSDPIRPDQGENPHPFAQVTHPSRHIERGGFHAIDWPHPRELSMVALLQQFPEFVVGKYLVNTSFDSGPLTLSESQIKAGWTRAGRLGHSPLIQHVDEVPHDQYDEWLVFDRPVRVDEFETMVNYLSFSPLDFGWDEKLQRFWNQVGQLSPLHVIGENDGLYLVSRNADLIRRISGR